MSSAVPITKPALGAPQAKLNLGKVESNQAAAKSAGKPATSKSKSAAATSPTGGDATEPPIASDKKTGFKKAREILDDLTAITGYQQQLAAAARLVQNTGLGIDYAGKKVLGAAGKLKALTGRLWKKSVLGKVAAIGTAIATGLLAFFGAILRTVGTAIEIVATPLRWILSGPPKEHKKKARDLGKKLDARKAALRKKLGDLQKQPSAVRRAALKHLGQPAGDPAISADARLALAQAAKEAGLTLG